MQSPLFESGIAKIQGKREDALSEAEADACKMFVKSAPIPAADAAAAGGGYAATLLAHAQASKRARIESSKYRSTNHVSPTTNILERLFSAAKLNMTALRKKMDPDSLNMLLFLKANRFLWRDARTVQEMLNERGGDISDDEEIIDGDDDDSDDEYY